MSGKERGVQEANDEQQGMPKILDGHRATGIAALFDMDNTILRASSMRVYLGFLLGEGYLDWRRRVGLAARAALYTAGLFDFPRLMAFMLSGVADGAEAAAWQTGEQCFEQRLQHKISVAARERIAWHSAQGHRVLVVSASAQYVVRPVARSLGLESDYLATRLEVVRGSLTGRVVEPACYGVGKVVHARAYAAQHNITLAQSYFYTDSYRDLPLLEAVGHPIPVNPDARLARIAMARGWSVLRFE